MRKLAIAVVILFAAISSLCINAHDGLAPLDALKKVTGIAKFTTDGVNLRQSPSTNSPYLVYQSGEELYYDPDNLIWSNQLGSMRIGGQLVLSDHEKIQGNKGVSLPVIGSEGDWIKLYYAPYEVWTMKKFVAVDPLVAPSSSSTYSPCDYNVLSLTGDADGSLAIYYQEAGMDEDEGFYIGKKVGNAIVFDRFLPMHVAYDETKQGVEISKDPQLDMLIFTFGPNAKAATSEYPVVDMKGFGKQDIESLMPLSQQTDEIVVMVATSDGIRIL